MYLEIAQGTPAARGVLIDKKDLAKYVNTKVPLYRSVYTYTEDVIQFKEQTGSIKSYFGERAIDHVPIDIDKGGNSDGHTLDLTRAVLMQLKDMDVEDSSFQVYFSGTGYHINISNEVFNFQTGTHLPLVVRSTMTKLFPDVDNSIYMRSGIYRVAHTINKKSGLYKIPLTTKEVWSLDADKLKQLAQEPRLEFPYEVLVGDGELEEHIVSSGHNIAAMQNVTEPSKVVPCVQTMLNQGPATGKRHNVILRIVSHLKRHGLPSKFAKVIIDEWNQGSMDDQEIISLIESAYNGNYRYSCNDATMKDYCSSKCIYFKRKDYLVDVKSSSDLQTEFEERLETDFEGKKIPLADMLGLEQDTDIYPGELVTIFGPTGSSKTTLAQCIALGVDFARNQINTKWQIPCLYLSLELSGWYMHRRNLQIVSDLSKDQVNADYKGVYERHSHLLEHMVIQTVSPTLEQIQSKVRELQPALVIIDYIDLVETPFHVKGEYEQVKYVSHNLSNMAVNSDMIVIQVSQVSRDYSRNEVLDLYAGKGSGAIENASRKVIGLNGQANSHKKSLHMFKNTDGELLDCELEWRPSFRLRRV